VAVQIVATIELFEAALGFDISNSQQLVQREHVVLTAAHRMLTGERLYQPNSPLPIPGEVRAARHHDAPAGPLNVANYMSPTLRPIRQGRFFVATPSAEAMFARHRAQRHRLGRPSEGHAGDAYKWLS
jgi:hypothetical protein